MTSPAPTRIAVVGLGTMGAQALAVLAESPGVQAIGFEQYNPGHDRGAAGGESRIFRSAQFEDHRFVPLIQEADARWRRLESDTGRRLRELNGCVLMGPPDHQHIVTAMESVTEYGLDYDVLDRSEMARRLPQFSMDEGDMAIYDRHAGSIRPELTVLSTTLLAERRGATVHRSARVLDIVPDDSGVTITTSAGQHRVDRAIVAAGPWVTGLLPELADVITVRRPVSAWYTARPGQPLPEGPAFIRLAPRHFYGVPSPDGISVKVGLSVVDHLIVDSPDTAERRVGLDELGPFDEVLARYLPTLQPEPIRLTSYFEAYLDDARPIVQTSPHSENLVLLAGFSGHGFKLSPAIGAIGAQLALGEKPVADIGFLHRDFTTGC